MAKFALSQTIPHLVQLFRNPDEALTRAATLELLADVILAIRDAPQNGVPEEHVTPLLSLFKDDILAVLVAGLKISSAYDSALKGLLGLTSAPAALTDEEIAFIVHSVNELARRMFRLGPVRSTSNISRTSRTRLAPLATTSTWVPST